MMFMNTFFILSVQVQFINTVKLTKLFEEPSILFLKKTPFTDIKLNIYSIMTYCIDKKVN